jgi:two-component system, LytTR family, sensor kinase
MSGPLRKQAMYWTTQAVAWTLYVSLLSLVNYANGSYHEGSGWLMVATLAAGVVASHAYRSAIVRFRWLEPGLGRQLPLMALGAILAGALAFLLQSVAHDLLFPGAEPVIGGNGITILEKLVGWIVTLFIWGLGYLGYHWFTRSRREELRNLRLESANRDSQLVNLRSQLNPHFMFNALNGIRALIDEDPARAKTAITQLSAILRNSMMTVRRETVPLGEELDIVRAYLDLEAMRFEERLRVSYDVEEGVERDPVPPMMLQTLTENAVRHGIAHITGGGRVEVGAHRTLEGLLLTVKNTGTYDPDAPKKVHTNGIGLQNTRRRLSMLYGGKAQLRIQNRDGMVVTEVEIPRAM